jgi:hypothetical protein
VVVKVSSRTPGGYQFSVTGKDGSYPVTAGQLPVMATIVLDPPYAATNQCGEVVFTAPSASCTYAANGVVKCK